MWSKLKKSFLSTPSLDFEIINENDFQFTLLIQPLIEELNTKDSRLKLAGKRVELIIPKDFGATVYKYAIEEEKEYYDTNGFSTSLGNFSIVNENDVICFKLIINPIVFEDSLYLSTVTHEFTHAIDFSGYINKYGNPFTMNSKKKRIC